MSWAARVTRTAAGGRRLRFSEPVRDVELDPPAARRLASLLLVAAEEADQATLDDVASSGRGKVDA